eukprot:s3652_g6.t1
MQEDTNPLVSNKRAQISAGHQPKSFRLPPIVAEFSSVAVFLANAMTDIPCGLMSKLDRDIQLHTKGGLLETVPKYSRFLRFSSVSARVEGGSEGQPLKKTKVQPPANEDANLACTVENVDDDSCNRNNVQFEAAFGLPWTCEGFIAQACSSGHPAAKDMGVPFDLEAAVCRNVEWNEVQLSSYRIAWCRKWLARAHELDALEREDAKSRHPAVAELTAGKRLLLTKELLEDVGYEDTAALRLLSNGATLAGEVEVSDAFDLQFKPCLITLEQLEADAIRRNEMILQMTCSSGSAETDLQMIEETELELAKGWAEGPFELSDLEAGATISRRFPLVQSTKTRMIDDFSISGVNDSCLSHNKVDLHLVDTFCSMVKMFFGKCDEAHRNSALVAKTYDLMSAYRQVPICPDHYKYAYVSVYNCKLQKVEIYRMRTMPFGATHSVYCFLRLARCLFALAVRGLYLMTTNFYDDFILAAQPGLTESCRNSMELLFMLTGWLYAKEGKKATSFAMHCKALGVEFDFNRSEHRILAVANTETRKLELIQQIEAALNAGKLEKQLCLVLRGKLGFADSFLHGRLGKLVLKKLIDHAYGRTSAISEDLRQALQAMMTRLKQARPKEISVNSFSQWFIYTDASFEPESATGGLGGVLVDSGGAVKFWFGLMLDETTCRLLGAADKGTIIYELELLASILALSLWHGDKGDELNVHFGDNDGVRFSLIKATAAGSVGQLLMEYHLKLEALADSRTWFARVPTEANIGDYPSRNVAHPLLTQECEVSLQAKICLDAILSYLARAGKHDGSCYPQSKTSALVILHCFNDIDGSVQQKEEEESPEEFEEIVVEEEEEGEEKKEELLPFHEFHGRRGSPWSIAQTLKKHIGMKFSDYCEKDAVTQFFYRYNLFAQKDWSFSTTWKGDQCKAVLKAPSLGDRTFEGAWRKADSDRDVNVSKHLAERSAIDAFQTDPEVVEIAALLPPSITKMKEMVFLTSEETHRIRDLRMNPRVVLREMLNPDMTKHQGPSPPDVGARNPVLCALVEPDGFTGGDAGHGGDGSDLFCL